METAEPLNRESWQLLGEIQTAIANLDRPSATIEPGEHVHLEREPDHRLDPEAIRVENGRREPLGYLPRKIVSWLTSLVDAGQVRLDGFVSKSAVPGRGESAAVCPLVLSVFLGWKGRNLLQGLNPRDELEALHELVRRAYLDAQRCQNPSMIERLADRLGDLGRGELLPGTRLLIALLPDVAREIRASHGLQTIARFRQLVGSVDLAPPVQHQNLTLFPLRWPEACLPGYRLLGQALETGEAVVEEFNEAASLPGLAVANRTRQPLLIPGGEVVAGAGQDHVLLATTLIAAGAKLVLPICCVAAGRWRSPSQDSAPYAPPSFRRQALRSAHTNRGAERPAERGPGEQRDETPRRLGGAGQSHQSPGWPSLPENAAGVLVGMDGRIVGMDLFDSPATFAILSDRLLNAYVRDGSRLVSSASAVPLDTARRFLDRLSTLARPCGPSQTGGDELQIAGEDIVGAALLSAGRICHLAAFRDPD